MIKNHAGGAVIRITPTLSTDAYADSEVLFNPTEIPMAVATRGGISELHTMFVLDSSDQQNTDIRFIFTEKNTTDLGTINATADISAANLKANKLLGTTFLDRGSSTGANIDNAVINQVMNASGAAESSIPSILLSADTGQRSVYVSAFIEAGTPTFAADSLELIFHIKYLD